MMDRDRGEHLPNLRPGRTPPHPSWLPRQRRGTTPQMIGRYPDFDVLDAVGTWDEATWKVVLARLEPPGPPRLFTPEEEPALRAPCDTCTAQDAEPGIPVAESVDAKLADGRLDGFRYAGMPDDRDTWRLVLRWLDEAAGHRAGTGFAGCDRDTREVIVADFAHGALSGSTWDQLNVATAWSVCRHAILSAFYSRPWAWNEIGFGGPVYPRGFMRMGATAVREPFETPGATAEDAVQAVEEGRLDDELLRGVPKGSIGPIDNDSRFLLDVHSRQLSGEATMRRHRDGDEVDLVIVGAGAGGSVLAQRLARAGRRVVIIEAGPFWHPDRDWVFDEAGSHGLYWAQKRIIGGADPIELGKNNSGRGVGGSMVPYADRWTENEAGIWELDPRHWTESQLICVAGLRAVAVDGAPANKSGDLLSLAEAIGADTAARATHPSGRWQRAPDDERLDAALLLPPLRGASAADDPRTLQTLRVLRDELAEDRYLYRFRQQPGRLGDAGGAFLLCGFAMAMALHQHGDQTKAARRFERNRAACGPPGLFTEEYDVAQRQLRGNLPQAFVHALMFEAAVYLAGPAGTAGS